MTKFLVAVLLCVVFAVVISSGETLSKKSKHGSSHHKKDDDDHKKKDDDDRKKRDDDDDRNKDDDDDKKHDDDDDKKRDDDDDHHRDDDDFTCAAGQAAFSQNSFSNCKFSKCSGPGHDSARRKFLQSLKFCGFNLVEGPIFAVAELAVKSVEVPSGGIMLVGMYCGLNNKVELAFDIAESAFSGTEFGSFEDVTVYAFANRNGGSVSRDGTITLPVDLLSVPVDNDFEPQAGKETYGGHCVLTCTPAEECDIDFDSQAGISVAGGLSSVRHQSSAAGLRPKGAAIAPHP